jgi:hypothetical protein
MIEEPPSLPVAIPEVTPRVSAVPVPDHVPPVTVFENVVVVPAHMVERPEMGAGPTNTFTFAVVVHDPSEYVMVLVPALIAETMPEGDKTMTDAVLLLHVPPGTELKSVSDTPVQRLECPVMAGRELMTVTVLVAVLQPE